MQAYHLVKTGSVSSPAEALAIREHPIPQPGPHEVLVRVRAVSLNYRDILLMQDRYPVTARADVIPVSDGAGEVLGVGEGVSRVAVGDMVAATYFTRWFDGRLSLPLAMRQTGASDDGMLAQYRVFNEESLVRLPAHLSFEEGATLTCAALTAWSCLTGPRPVLAGETVVTGGTGGLALFALQFAKLFGARTIALTSSQEKVRRLRLLGADEVINYRETPDWDAEVQRLTGGAGAEHVVDSVGVATLERSLKAAAFGGEVVAPGAFNSPGATFDPRAMAGRLVSIRRVAVGSRAAFEAMTRAIALHKLKPVIDRVFGFDEVHAAYRHFEAQKHIGKVVIAVH
jgi:NADPH:quinone reductase-like Zn-dependent oxidoreductase